MGLQRHRYLPRRWRPVGDTCGRSSPRSFMQRDGELWIGTTGTVGSSQTAGGADVYSSDGLQTTFRWRSSGMTAGFGSAQLRAFCFRWEVLQNYNEKDGLLNSCSGLWRGRKDTYGSAPTAVACFDFEMALCSILRRTRVSQQIVLQVWLLTDAVEPRGAAGAAR